MLRKPSAESTAEFDSIVFDCDGVLVDVRKSYDAAIVATVDWLVRRMFNLVLPLKGPCTLLIQGLRNTGGFNNDWDTVYAISLFVASSLPDECTGHFSPKRTRLDPGFYSMSTSEAAPLFRRARLMVDAIKPPIGSSRRSPAEAVWNSLPEDKLALCRRVREYLGYPGNPPSSLLASLFDETYHGGSLFREMYGVEPRYHRGQGFIENDRVLVRQSDLSALSRAAGKKLAIITGRPREAAEYTLGDLMSYFDSGASVFIGDGDIHPTPEADSLRKPSGKSLLLVRERLRSRRLVYVADSAEDVQMVRNARRSAQGIAFAGVYASSYEPEDQLRFFKDQGAEIILPSVRELARAMEELGAE